VDFNWKWIIKKRSKSTFMNMEYQNQVGFTYDAKAGTFTVTMSGKGVQDQSCQTDFQLDPSAPLGIFIKRRANAPLLLITQLDLELFK
jgi:hypothetical protein